MAKKQTTPSAFDGVLDSFGLSSSEMETTTDMDTKDTFVDVDEKQEKEEPAPTKVEDDQRGAFGKVDDSEIPQEVLDRMDGKKPTKEPEEKPAESLGEEKQPPVTEEPVEEEVDDNKFAEVEAQNVTALFDAMAESLGWDDVKDNEKPTSVDELVQYMHDTVEQNSVPQYADERVAQLDEYIKNGGNFEDFYSIQKETLSLDNIDIENEDNQKAVVRQYLKASGYSDSEVSRKIERYEDADLLQEEAEDALGKLKAYREAEQEQMAREQATYRQQQEEQTRAFYQDVTGKINKLTQIRGIAVPKEDRQALYNYIFRVDANGQSQYQKDFNKNMVKNLIESAYLTMKGDALINGAKHAGETSAANKLRQIMRHASKNRSTYDTEEKQRSVLDLTKGMF